MPEEKYTTQNEISFIGYLVREGGIRERITKLVSYRETIDVRCDWGKIDKSAVLTYVNELIERLSNRKK